MEKWQNLFLNAGGRIGQKDYWIGLLIVVVVSFVLGIVLGMVPLLPMLVHLASLYAIYCLSAKRLHDAGKSAQLAAIVCIVLAVVTLLVDLAGSATALGAMTGSGAALGGGLAFLFVLLPIAWLVGLAGLGFLIWVGVMNGDPAPNAYGAPKPSVFDSNTTPTTSA